MLFHLLQNIDGPMDAMRMRHSPEQWRLFIGASKQVLKQSSYTMEISCLHSCSICSQHKRNVYNYKQHPVEVDYKKYQ